MASTRGNPVSRERRAFDFWIRTGRIMEPKVEAKFNPWHDPGDGRFTFANSGRFWGSDSLHCVFSAQALAYDCLRTIAAANTFLTIPQAVDALTSGIHRPFPSECPDS